MTTAVKNKIFIYKPLLYSEEVGGKCILWKVGRTSYLHQPATSSKVTCEPSSRKRKIGKEELVGKDLMQTTAAQFRKDGVDEAARMQSLNNLIILRAPRTLFDPTGR